MVWLPVAKWIYSLTIQAFLPFLTHLGRVTDVMVKTEAENYLAQDP